MRGWGCKRKSFVLKRKKLWLPSVIFFIPSRPPQQMHGSQNQNNPSKLNLKRKLSHHEHQNGSQTTSKKLKISSETPNSTSYTVSNFKKDTHKAENDAARQTWKRPPLKEPIDPQKHSISTNVIHASTVHSISTHQLQSYFFEVFLFLYFLLEKRDFLFTLYGVIFNDFQNHFVSFVAKFNFKTLCKSNRAVPGIECSLSFFHLFV
jgi:hypothetical protein